MKQDVKRRRKQEIEKSPRRQAGVSVEASISAWVTMLAARHPGDKPGSPLKLSAAHSAC